MLLACGLLGPNPSAVGAEQLLRRPDSARGIMRVTRHPVMWAILLWAVAHVLARGELAALLFFGTFAVLAALGMLLLDSRKARELGEDWTRFADVTSVVPFGAIAGGRNRLGGREIGWRNPAIGLALYAAFFWLHPAIFGARPY